MNVAIIHLFYPELVDEVINKALELPVEKIIATTCSESILKSVTEKNIDTLEISLVENKGMDIGPFLLSLDKVPDNCNYIYKLHTKKDNKWRNELFDGLPNNPDGKVIYGSQKWIFKDNPKYKTDKIIKLAKMLGFVYPNKQFIAGTIFCIRKDILFKWFYDSRNKIYNLLETGFFNDLENSTWTHSMERILSCLYHFEKDTLYDIKMPVDFNNKFIFVHIPKTGGSSIEEVLRINNPENFFDDRRDVFKFSPQHWTPEMIKREITDYDNYFKFTFVRHPLKRIISEWRWRKNLDETLKDFNIWINDFLDSETDHSVPQSMYCDDSINFIGKYENLQNDFNQVLTLMGLDEIQLPHTNKSYHTSPINISLKSRDLIYEYYKEDFKRFDYE